MKPKPPRRFYFSIQVLKNGSDNYIRIKTWKEGNEPTQTVQKFPSASNDDELYRLAILRHFFFLYGTALTHQRLTDMQLDPGEETIEGTCYTTAIDICSSTVYLVPSEVNTRGKSYRYEGFFELPGRHPYTTYAIVAGHSYEAVLGMPRIRFYSILLYTVACVTYLKNVIKQYQVEEILSATLGTLTSWQRELGLIMIDPDDDISEITYH